MDKLVVEFDDLPKEQASKPEVFVIEGLRDEDFRARRADGYILYRQLQLLGKKPRYVVVAGLNEFKAAMVMFRLSNYRMLHVSCHGTCDSVALGGENVDYDTFAEATKSCLKSRRITFSACGLGNRDLAQRLFCLNKGMHSFVAPVERIEFDVASALWVPFYTKFLRSGAKLKHTSLEDVLSPLVDYWGVKAFVAFVDTKCKRIRFRDPRVSLDDYIAFDDLYGES